MATEKKAKLSASFIAAAKKSGFNQTEWAPKGEPVSFINLVKAGVYDDLKLKDIDMEKSAEITEVVFDDGNSDLRISVPLVNGASFDLNLSPKSDLEEGDEVAIASITGQELVKGSKSIVKYDAVLADEYDEDDDDSDDEDDDEDEDDGLEEMDIKDLKAMAKELGIKKPNKMSKEELIEAIREAKDDDEDDDE